MAQQNLYELDLSPEEQGEIEAALDVLVTRLGPRLNSLTVAERRELPKMGDKTVAFVEKTHEYGVQNPHLVPVFVDMAMFNADLTGSSQLNRYLRVLKPLVSSMDDSRMLAGSEAYQAALMIYHNTKMAAASGIANAKAVYEDLAARFPGGARKRASQPDSN